ncbi:MAG: GntR family transcriptional regulator [Spirochaetales bacterium]|nr:GntR family transcriptional regulator [Spirochaetales bacterium]
MNRTLDRTIREKIEALKFGNSPSIICETDIAKELGVDRHSVRRAIRKCAKIGMLHPIRGKGYAVNIDEVEVNISSTTNYTEGQKKLEKTPLAKIVDFSLVKPSKELKQYFDPSVHERIWLVEFKRYLDDIPFSTTCSFLPFFGLEDLNLHLKECQSLYQVLKSEFGLKPRRLWSTCVAESASDHTSRLLQIPGGFPVLKVCSLVKDEYDGDILEYCETYFRSDLVRIRFNIEGQGHQED